MGVALSVTLARRGGGHGRRETANRLVVVPVVAVVAFGVGNRLVHQPVIGSALFVIAVSGAVWVRRFGPVGTRIGTFVPLPFVAVLVTPMPVGPSSGSTLLPWAAGVSLVASAISTLVTLIAESTGLLARPSPPPPLVARTASIRRPTTRRLSTSTRMALQLAAALSAAFIVGHLLLGQHWPWVVITAYVVTSGNRGRGDVAYKGILRVAGALVGTAAATLLSGLFAPGNPAAIVGIFVALAIGTVLRSVNYAFWAASVTAALALLYGFIGEGGEQLLLFRIVGVLIGGALAVACAWFILPIRTTDVLRRRMFDALAVLSDILTAARVEPARLELEAARFQGSLRAIEQLVPTLRAADLVLRIRRIESRRGHIVASLNECVAPVELLVQVEQAVFAESTTTKLVARVAKRVGGLRRALADRTVPEDSVPEPFRPSNDAETALRAIELTVASWCH